MPGQSDNDGLLAKNGNAKAKMTQVQTSKGVREDKKLLAQIYKSSGEKGRPPTKIEKVFLKLMSVLRKNPKMKPKIRSYCPKNRKVKDRKVRMKITSYWRKKINV